VWVIFLCLCFYASIHHLRQSQCKDLFVCSCSFVIFDVNFLYGTFSKTSAHSASFSSVINDLSTEIFYNLCFKAVNYSKTKKLKLVYSNFTNIYKLFYSSHWFWPCGRTLSFNPDGLSSNPTFVSKIFYYLNYKFK